jgi:hypothetical protein
MGAPLLAPAPSIGYCGRGTSSRRNLNLHKSPSWWCRSRRVLFQRRSSRSFEEAQTSPKPEIMDASSASNVTPSIGCCGRGTSFRCLTLPYLQKTASTQSRRGLFKSMRCRSFGEEQNIPNPEPEFIDASATQSLMLSNLNPEVAASKQSRRRLFQSEMCRSLVERPTASRTTFVHQISRCSLRCITEKAVEPVSVKPIEPMKSTRHRSDARKHVSHKRHVHFSFDSNDDDGNTTVQVETIYYKIAPTECKSNLAWKSEEIKEFQQTCRDLADFYKTNEDYVACIKHLFACRHSAPAIGGNNDDDDDDDNVPQNSSVRQDTTAIRMLSKSPARGLEARVAPILCAHRQWSVTAILATQAKLNKCKVTDNEKREKMLRARSLQTSKRSRVFALKLAQGDASEALMAID